MWKQKIADNLVSDSYIFIFVVINIAVLAVIYYCIVAEKREKRRNKGNEAQYDLKQNKGWASSMRKGLNISQSLYNGITSVFPLLGMFGTVKSLLNLPSLTEGDISAVQNSFVLSTMRNSKLLRIRLLLMPTSPKRLRRFLIHLPEIRWL